MKIDVVTIVVVVVVFFVLGAIALPATYDAGQRTIQQDCDNFGAFVINKEKYECKRE